MKPPPPLKSKSRRRAVPLGHFSLVSLRTAWPEATASQLDGEEKSSTMQSFVMGRTLSAHTGELSRGAQMKSSVGYGITAESRIRKLTKTLALKIGGPIVAAILEEAMKTILVKAVIAVATMALLSGCVFSIGGGTS